MNKEAIAQHIKKYKNYYHALLGLVILIFWYFMLRGLGSLYEGALLIMSVICAKGFERLQKYLKWGTDTMEGTFKTAVPALVFVIMQLIQLI